jgi:hypothetical protein
MRYKKGDLVVWRNEVLRPACYQSENIMLITDIRRVEKHDCTIYHYTYLETQRKDIYVSFAYEVDTKPLE